MLTFVATAKRLTGAKSTLRRVPMMEKALHDEAEGQEGHHDEDHAVLIAPPFLTSRVC
jgi:hypothetical protein